MSETDYRTIMGSTGLLERGVTTSFLAASVGKMKA